MDNIGSCSDPSESGAQITEIRRMARWKEEQRWWHQSQVELLKGFGINVISNQVDSKRERRAEQRKLHQSRFKDLAFGIAMVAAESE